MAEGDISNSERLARKLWGAVCTGQGDHDKIRSLLRQGADPNHQLYWSEEWNRGFKYPPLHYACSINDLEAVKMLVQAGASIDKLAGNLIKYTPLHKACSSGRKDVVMYLIEEAGCTVNIRDSNGRSPLDLALSSFGPGNDPLDLPLYLINSGYGGIEKKTELLFRGCYYGQLDVVKEMVEQHNVDPKGVRDEETRTPLHVASLRAHKNVVEYLVEEANCDVNARDNKHLQTPLHMSCFYYVNLDVVRYLIEKAHCDINVRDKNNQTALHKCCSTSWGIVNLDVVRYLIEEAHCDANATDDEGRTPLDLTMRRWDKKKWSEVIDYLKSWQKEAEA